MSLLALDPNKAEAMKTAYIRNAIDTQAALHSEKRRAFRTTSSAMVQSAASKQFNDEADAALQRIKAMGSLRSPSQSLSVFESSATRPAPTEAGSDGWMEWLWNASPASITKDAKDRIDALRSKAIELWEDSKEKRKKGAQLILIAAGISMAMAASYVAGGNASNITTATGNSMHHNSQPSYADQMQWRREQMAGLPYGGGEPQYSNGAMATVEAMQITPSIFEAAVQRVVQQEIAAMAGGHAAGSNAVKPNAVKPMWTYADQMEWRREQAANTPYV